MNPADTARPGDCFRDENGVTWLLTASLVSDPWVTSRPVDGHVWHSAAEARERTLTPVVPATATATADGEALGRLVRDVRDAEEPGHTCTIDGVLIAKVDTYGQTAAYRAAMTRIADALRVAHGDRIDVDGLVRVAEAAAGALADREAALDAAAVPDASNAAHLRFAADVAERAHGKGWSDGDSAVIDYLRRRANRLDVAAADRAKATKFLESKMPAWRHLDKEERSTLVAALVEFNRARRDSERDAE